MHWFEVIPIGDLLILFDGFGRVLVCEILERKWYRPEKQKNIENELFFDKKRKLGLIPLKLQNISINTTIFEICIIDKLSKYFGKFHEQLFNIELKTDIASYPSSAEIPKIVQRTNA